MRQKKTKGVVLLAAALCLTGTWAAAETFPYITTTIDTVNMRRSAAASSVVLEQLDDGEIITVTGEKGNYYAVNARNRSGYVLKVYVTDVATQEQRVQGVVMGTAEGYPYDTTTNDKVNLRAKESSEAKLLTVVPADATVTVLSVGESYVKVNYNGQEGYCSIDFLNMKDIVEPSEAPVPEEGLVARALAPQKLSYGAGYEVLQTGATGAGVKALQSALKELGFFSGAVDGNFGPATYQAVVAMQQKNKYPATGIVDANLQAFLYNGKPLNNTGKAVQVKTLAPIEGVTVSVGKQGELVERIQIRLTELGYYHGEVSGTFDTKTSTATKTFQKKNGLTADGKAGVKTVEMLFGGDALSAQATPTPKPTATPKPTPVPTPRPTLKAPTAKVQRGSSGNNAKMVQKRLEDLHYYTGKVDGKFGSDSEKALKAFQKKHGLKVDGIAGASTYALLFSYDALDANATATPAPVVETLPPVVVTQSPAVTTYAPITKDNVVTVKMGTSGESVARLQQRLTALGYYKAAVDSVCKQVDVNAIKAFQKKNGLKVDGVAGYDTQVKLYSLTAVSAVGVISGGTVDTFTTLRMGSKGDSVKQLQARLTELGYFDGKQDGIYGSATSNAVIAFQRMNNLTRDGVAGKGTQSLLYSATAATPTPVPVTTPAASAAPSVTITGTVKKGDSNSNVKALQQRLIELGYLSGKADGVFGLQTYQAVVSFQKAVGLKADGIAGSLTLNKLTAANKPTNAPSGIVPPPPVNSTVTASTVRASQVQYLNWYTSAKAKCKSYPYATVYDYNAGTSWQVHMFSFGAHADAEPLTVTDTAAMVKTFGGETWDPRPVWVILGDGTVLMASTHSYPHDPQHRTDNNFNGHMCIHFPRTSAQVAAIGPYATRHQATLDAGWQATQLMK